MRASSFIEVIQRAKYKAGWTFTVKAPDPSEASYGLYLEPIRVVIQFMAPNVKNPSETIPVRMSAPISEYAVESFCDEQDALEWLRSEIIRMEIHEMDEWLTYRGRHVRVPHPKMEAA